MSMYQKSSSGRELQEVGASSQRVEVSDTHWRDVGVQPRRDAVLPLSSFGQLVSCFDICWTIVALFPKL